MSKDIIDAEQLRITCVWRPRDDRLSIEQKLIEEVIWDEWEDLEGSFNGISEPKLKENCISIDVMAAFLTFLFSKVEEVIKFVSFTGGSRRIT